MSAFDGRCAMLELLLSLGVVVLGAQAWCVGPRGRRCGSACPPLFVGLTIVAFGTSSPELAAILVATWRGAVGVSVGNVVGSHRLSRVDRRS